ncbi:hypothetical protein RCL1_003936 [Eukaryota sp. TZLM3-RCL]
MDLIRPFRQLCNELLSSFCDATAITSPSIARFDSIASVSTPFIHSSDSLSKISKSYLSLPSSSTHVGVDLTMSAPSPNVSKVLSKQAHHRSSLFSSSSSSVPPLSFKSSPSPSLPQTRYTRRRSLKSKSLQDPSVVTSCQLLADTSAFACVCRIAGLLSSSSSPPPPSLEPLDSDSSAELSEVDSPTLFNSFDPQILFDFSLDHGCSLTDVFFRGINRIVKALNDHANLIDSNCFSTLIGVNHVADCVVSVLTFFFTRKLDSNHVLDFLDAVAFFANRSSNVLVRELLISRLISTFGTITTDKIDGIALIMSFSILVLLKLYEIPLKWVVCLLECYTSIFAQSNLIDLLLLTCLIDSLDFNNSYDHYSSFPCVLKFLAKITTDTFLTFLSQILIKKSKIYSHLSNLFENVRIDLLTICNSSLSFLLDFRNRSKMSTITSRSSLSEFLSFIIPNQNSDCFSSILTHSNTGLFKLIPLNLFSVNHVCIIKLFNLFISATLELISLKNSNPSPVVVSFFSAITELSVLNLNNYSYFFKLLKRSGLVYVIFSSLFNSIEVTNNLEQNSTEELTGSQNFVSNIDYDSDSSDGIPLTPPLTPPSFIKQLIIDGPENNSPEKNPEKIPTHRFSTLISLKLPISLATPLIIFLSNVLVKNEFINLHHFNSMINTIFNVNPEVKCAVSQYFFKNSATSSRVSKAEVLLSLLSNYQSFSLPKSRLQGQNSGNFGTISLVDYSFLPSECVLKEISLDNGAQRSTQLIDVVDEVFIFSLLDSLRQSSQVVVPRLYDFGLDMSTNSIWILMEKGFDCMNLRHSVINQIDYSDLPFSTVDGALFVLNFALKLANILVALSEFSISHSDFKLSNILFRPKVKESQSFFSDFDLILIDFGEAFISASSSFYPSHRPNESKFPDRERGTLYIRAPEALESQHLSKAHKYPPFWSADVWAFGIVLIELILGTPPNNEIETIDFFEYYCSLLPENTHEFISNLLRLVFVWDPHQRPHPTMIVEILSKMISSLNSSSLLSINLSVPSPLHQSFSDLFSQSNPCNHCRHLSLSVVPNIFLCSDSPNIILAQPAITVLSPSINHIPSYTIKLKLGENFKNFDEEILLSEIDTLFQIVVALLSSDNMNVYFITEVHTEMFALIACLIAHLIDPRLSLFEILIDLRKKSQCIAFPPERIAKIFTSTVLPELQSKLADFVS